MIDIPTALTVGETNKLREVCTDKFVLEIGALLGYSTVAIAQVARGLVSIDPHDGYPDHDPKPTWETWLANVIRYDVFDKVKPVRNTWQNAFSVFQDGKCPLPYEVVFMDLTGKYEDTLECLLHFWRNGDWGDKVKTICVHDCGHPDWPGVMDAVNRFKEYIDPNFCYTQVDKLGVFEYV